MGGIINNLQFSGVSAEQQKLVNNTLKTLDQDPFLAKQFDEFNKSGASFTVGNGGLQEGAAANTFFTDKGNVDSVQIGQSVLGSKEDFAAAAFNEIFSGNSVPGIVNSKGGLDQAGGFENIGTKQQEFGSFFGGGYAAEIAAGNKAPTAEDALKYYDNYYQEPTGDVVKNNPVYSDLKVGSNESSGLGFSADNKLLPKEFTEEAQKIINDTLGGGNTGNSANGTEQSNRQNLTQEQNAALDKLKDQTKNVADEFKNKTGKDIKDASAAEVKQANNDGKLAAAAKKPTENKPGDKPADKTNDTAAAKKPEDKPADKSKDTTATAKKPEDKPADKSKKDEPKK
jgi:hypothetical protein